MSLFKGVYVLSSLICAGGQIFLTILSVWAAEQKHLLSDARPPRPTPLSIGANVTGDLIEALQCNKPIKVPADDNVPSKFFFFPPPDLLN